MFPSVQVIGNASLVVCSGKGLKMGIMGHASTAVIDTRGAGPGEITASCQGPNQEAQCSLANNRNGTFTLTITPKETGLHALHVRYNNNNVPGSPYMLQVSKPPDASKVNVFGPGLESGILSNHDARFIVETEGAGAGQLTVRVRGPRSAFRVVMKRDSQKDRTILCSYNPTEVGKYYIYVQWSGVNVPGSPFRVRIADTNEELKNCSLEDYFESTNGGTGSRVFGKDF